MRKKNYLLLSFIPLLTACSSYTGMVSPQYDGVMIETDADALHAYAETQEIIDTEKEILGQVLPDFFYEEPLDFMDETYMRPLTQDPLTIGEDLPEGRYTIIKSDEMGTGYLTILDTDDTKVYEQLLDYTQSTLELNLYEGMKIMANEGYLPRLLIMGKAVEPISLLGEAVPLPEAGSMQLGNGVYHVGEQIEPGEYAIEVAASFNASGVNYVYALNPDGSFHVFELTAAYQEGVDVSITLPLIQGQTLFIASKATTVLTPNQ